MKPQDIFEQFERQKKFDLVHEALENIELNQRNKKISRVDAIFLLESILNEWEESILKVTDEVRKEKLKVRLRQLYFVHDTWSDILTSEVYARQKLKLMERKCLNMQSEINRLNLLVEKMEKQIEFNEL
jgi:hypothetical protein